MDDKDKIINEQGMQIVLIHRDIKSMTDIIVNIEKTLSTLVVLDRTLLQHQATMDGMERRLVLMEREYTDMRQFHITMTNDMNTRLQVLKDSSNDARNLSQKEIMLKLEEIVKNTDSAFKDKDERIRSLESWRWYLLGIMVAAGFFISGIPWQMIFNI